MLSPLDVMERQVSTLFRHDTVGRLLAVNESDSPSAPRVFLGRTTAGNLWRFRHDLTAALVRELTDILRAEPVTGDPSVPCQTLDRLTSALTAHGSSASVWQGPAWYVPDDVGTPNAATVAQLTDVAVLRTHYPHMHEWIGDCLPCVVVLEHEQAVAVCFSSRTSNVAAEAGVETVAAYRGRGYAVAAVAEWARAVRATGRLPLYSTSWDNLASQGVARRLGLMLYGTDLHIT
jgi:RimJ/RimL family protein N-acetyltransferase